MRTLVYKIVLLSGLLSFLCQEMNAQYASISINRDKILLGEHVQVTLKVQDVNPKATDINRWFVIPDSANHIEVVRREPMETVKTNGVVTYIQNIVVTSFDSGRWQLQVDPVLLQDKNTRDTFSFNNRDIYIDVLTVDVSSMLEYHDIKDIKPVEVSLWTYFLINILPTAAIVVGILLVIVAIIIILRRRKNRKPVITPEMIEDAREKAIRQLKELKKELPSNKEQVKQFYQKVDDICRNYLAASRNIDALYCTSGELMIQLRDEMTDEELYTRLSQWLKLCDVVKFAKYCPPDEKQLQVIDEALYLIEKI